MLSRRIISTYKKPISTGDILYLSKDVLTSNLDPSSGSVTVPASADAILVSAVGHQSFKQGTVFFDELNFDNGGTQDFLHIGSCRLNTQLTGGMFIMTTASADWPGAGAKTLYWSGPVNNDNYNAGVSVVVAYWSGMRQIDPIRDTEVRDLTGITEIEESSLVGVLPTDMSVGVAWSFDQIPDAAPAGYGQTAIDESFYNQFGVGVQYELGESVMRFENLRAANAGIVWAAIKAA